MAGVVQDIQQRIALALPGLSASERRVGEVVHADPEAVVQGTVARLARRAGVSDPTVLRFCRSIGFEGYTDFRLALVRGTPVAAAPRPPTPDMPAAEAAAAVLGLAEAELARLRRTLEATACDQAVMLLRTAPRVEIWPDAEASAAGDAVLRALLARGRPAAMRTPAVQPLAAAGLKRGDLVVALATIAEVPALEQAVAVASGAGAALLVVAPEDGLLARQAPVALRLPANPQASPSLLLFALAEALAAVLKETP
jgi:DNA-binding MurR/RpiR family transcriptional regulator